MTVADISGAEKAGAEIRQGQSSAKGTQPLPHATTLRGFQTGEEKNNGRLMGNFPGFQTLLTET
ncbi:hypothetical protein GCM10027348_19350 [Hymenobacter tenuis]